MCPCARPQYIVVAPVNRLTSLGAKSLGYLAAPQALAEGFFVAPSLYAHCRSKCNQQLATPILPTHCRRSQRILWRDDAPPSCGASSALTRVRSPPQLKYFATINCAERLLMGILAMARNKVVSDRLTDLRPLPERILGLVVQGNEGMSAPTFQAQSAGSRRQRNVADAQTHQFGVPNAGLEEQFTAIQQSQGTRP